MATPRSLTSKPLAVSAARLAGWSTLIALGFMAGSANAQAPDTTLWVANGVVRAVARAGNTIFIGGSFSTVGPATGGGVPVSATTGAPIAPYPKVAGAVFSVIPDGAGGLYIGGLFSAVGGHPCSNLAHLRADGSVAPWTPDVDGEVQGLALSGNKIYALGYFQHVDGQPRSGIAAVNATSGALDAWDPHVDITILSLAASGGAVYLAGNFTQAGGQPRNGLAAVDTVNGTATSWDPNPNDVTITLAMSGGVLYAGGNFTSIGGATRFGLAAFDLVSGAVTGWDPHPSDPGIYLLAAGGNIVCAGGGFSSIGGQPRNAFAALDATTGNATGLDLGAAYPGFNVVATDGNTVFGAGYASAQAMDALTGAPTAWNPDASDAIRALAVSGSTVYIGGEFRTLGGTARHDLAALDATTGAVTSWDAHIDEIGQYGVGALAVHGTNLYVAGAFASIAGQPDTALTALDLTTGAVTWTPHPNGTVRAFAIVGDILYVGGSFTSIGGQLRKNVAAFDLTTGDVTPWQQTATGNIYALAADPYRIYAGGGLGVAALDATTGAKIWGPGGSAAVLALAVNGNMLYVGGQFGSLGGQTRSGLAAVDASTGIPTTWNPSTNATVYALVVSDGLVHVAGYFSDMGGQPRNCFATLREATGLAAAFNPDVEGDYLQLPDGSGYYSGGVLALCLSGNSLYLGGEFSSVSTWPSVAVAGFTFDAATPTMLSLANASAEVGRVRLEWYSDGAVDRATVYRRTATSEWSPIGTVVSNGLGTLDYVDTDVIAGARYGYRLGATVGGAEQWFGEAWVDVPLSAKFALAGARPNPAFAGLNVAFSLPDAAPARIEVLDVQGRLVLRREVGSLGAGSHVVNLAGGRMPSPGVYLLRLTRGAQSATARMIVSR